MNSSINKADKLGKAQSKPTAESSIAMLDAAQRLALAKKMSKNFSATKLDEFERKLAERIFMVLASDTEIKVRKILSDSLKNNADLPREVAMKLASDVIEVAEPILIHSKVLNDADLKHIVKTSETVAHKVAIAMREAISPELTGELAETGESAVIKTLVANKGAEFTEQIIFQVLDRHAGNNSILESLVKRGDMPLGAIERMVSMVSGELKKELMNKYSLSDYTASKVLDSSREYATLGLISLRKTSEEIEEVVNQIYEDDRLTQSLVLRALCMGDLDFFQAALAKLAGVPFKNAKSLIEDNGKIGFKALYRAANMPMSIFEAVRIATILALEETDGGKKTVDNYQMRLIERITEEGYAGTVDNMSYILGALGNTEVTQAV